MRPAPFVSAAVAVLLSMAVGAPGLAQSPVALWGSGPLEAGTAQIPGASSSGLEREIALRLRNVPLAKALQEIRRKAGLRLTYSDDMLPAGKRVDLVVERIAAGVAVARVLEGTGLALAVTATGQAAVIRRPDPASVREGGEGTVAGRVADASTRGPLAGARVVVGTRWAALTDPDGRFTITGVPSGTHRARISMLGYAGQERDVDLASGSSAVVNLSLEPQAISLQGVVAVGYGTRRRRDITGSIASVEVAALRTAPVSSVEQLFQGRAAGVQVTQNNGAPGGRMSVRIRGTNSITANSEPLYVVDGVPAFVGSRSSDPDGGSPLADLNPNDIESISILKDASSTAIYGARGASGVVLITTHRGMRGESRARIESSYGVQQVTRTIPVLDARQFAELLNEARVNAGEQAIFPAEQIAGLGRGTNWQDQIFRAAPVQNHSLTISGGDEKTRYLLTGGLYDQEGIVKGSAFRRYSARLNLDREVAGRLRIGSNLALSRTLSDVVPTETHHSRGVVATALQFSPTATVRGADGNYTPASPYTIPLANPVATALEVTDQRTGARVMGNVFGEYDLSGAVRFRTSLGGGATFTHDAYYAPRTTLEGSTTGGHARVASVHATDLASDNLLTYRKGLRDGHDLDLITGFSIQTRRSEWLQGEAQQFATDITGASNLGAGALPLSPGSGVDEWTLLSYLGRASYSLLDRYLVTVTARYDGSSRFGENDKWGVFPSAAFAWRLSEEPFLADHEWLSDARLRIGYGVTGNQEIGTYASLPRLVPVPYVLGSHRVTAYAPATRAPNPDLKWEQSRQFNAGLELALWDERLQLTADVYSGTTSDLLLEVPLAKSSGFRSQLRNVGSVRNRGVELSIGAIHLERDDLWWRSRLNVGANRNEVVSLGGPARIFPADARGFFNFEGGVSNVVQVGQPLGSFFGYRTDGLWQLEDDYGRSGDPHAAPGEWRYVDVNGDGRITAQDRTLIGNAEPKLFGGLTSSLVSGPFAVDVVFQGSYGNRVINAASVYFKSVTGFVNEHAQALERWRPDRPSHTVPRANLTRVRRLIDVYVEDASHLRLQSMSLAYRLPEGVLPGARQARVYVSGQNLWVWHGYTGYDPEVNSYGGDPSMRGVDLGMYPRSRTVNVGTSLTF